jgi:hypothetical protein
MSNETTLAGGDRGHVDHEHPVPPDNNATVHSTQNTSRTPRTEVPQPGPGSVPPTPYPPSE